MSEYQYYEFAAIDRPLTAEQMTRLRALSSRASITPTRFCNFYTYGDFKGDPAALMEEYFDAFVYVTNWGTHELMLRLPRGLLDRAITQAHCSGESLSACYTGDHVILDYCSQDADGADLEEDDGDGWMSALTSLRAELASGDHRSLYLGWLCSAQARELQDDALEPTVPSGLGALSTAQQMLALFLRLDPDLLHVASEASLPPEPALSRQSIEAWLRCLKDSERLSLLVRLLADSEPHRLRAELIQRAKRAVVWPDEQVPGSRRARRTMRDLLAAAARQAEARTRAACEKAERERQQLARAQAAARARYLEGLIGHTDELWQQVEALVATKRQADYTAAVKLVQDLHDVSARQRQLDTFMPRLQQLRARHAKKVSLLDRLDRAQLA
jgi:hypothetical protein